MQMMNPKRIKSRFRAAALVLALTVAPAAADVTPTDMLVAGRAIGFIDNLPRGDVRVAIVYDPDVAQSAQEASEINTLMGDGMRIGSRTLRPTLLPVGQASSNGAGLFFLTSGVGAEAGAVAHASRARKVPCITFDLSQVRNGNCAMGVQSQPRIEVFVNRAAADASGIVLATVFRIMITEI